MSLRRTAKLNTGATIPLLGFGTAELKGQEAVNAVKKALETGYRHIDTAWFYGNEKEVGEAIRQSNVPREEIHVTTKLWNNSHRPEDVLPAFETSLKNLGLDYVDLYLMHWPIAFKPGPDPKPKDENGKALIVDIDIVDTYKAMEELMSTGKVKALGVSNFSINSLEKLLKSAKIVPAVNQVELHPENPQWDLLEYCQGKGIHLTGYAPLGYAESPLMKGGEISDIAKKHNSSNANVLLAWAQQRGTSVVPKAGSEEHIKSNFQDIELDEEDLKVLRKIAQDDVVKRYRSSEALYGTDVFGDQTN